MFLENTRPIIIFLVSIRGNLPIEVIADPTRNCDHHACAKVGPVTSAPVCCVRTVGPDEWRRQPLNLERFNISRHTGKKSVGEFLQ